ncbi:hypothetical protein [Thiocapsa roseopersicina]|uniref:Uncharacterized protein n=1 Tax=Thiocapsa roseopersicina TaxID=1058 RepID=A0A1H3CPC7_THIRO|nr:hypothetical protein [Thiocapsa roseopersicina]SDX55890.1 hypothetical protein SAMN05421783_13619 [Thiocapsa roseopersicina]
MTGCSQLFRSHTRMAGQPHAAATLFGNDADGRVCLTLGGHLVNAEFRVLKGQCVVPYWLDPIAAAVCEGALRGAADDPGQPHLALMLEGRSIGVFKATVLGSLLLPDEHSRFRVGVPLSGGELAALADALASWRESGEPGRK